MKFLPFFSHCRSLLEKVGKKLLWWGTTTNSDPGDLRPYLPLVAPEAIHQDLTKCITKIRNHPIARGGFGDIWKCIYQSDRGPTNVAVKSLRIYAYDEAGEMMEQKSRASTSMKRILHELKIWAGVKHPNILPVYGYTSGFGPFIATVSPWADNGNLETYLKREDANISLVRRFQILKDVAAGLQYLHDHDVIHGDLTGQNVLINGDGTACLADFGLSLQLSELMNVTLAPWTPAFHGNVRWLAPELLGEPEDDLPVQPSKYSDIYSFGGIMLHVLTSKIPYYYLLGDTAVLGCIYAGRKPDRSRYPAFSNEYWHFVEECWSAAPSNRPSAERVVEVIRDELDSLSSSVVRFQCKFLSYFMTICFLYDLIHAVAV